MSDSNSTSSAGGACRTEYKRQKIFLKTEKSTLKDQNEGPKDPLPIVELKPFVKKVWRRENSLPGYYDRFPPSKPSQHVRKQKDNERLVESPVTPSPSPDKLEMFIGNIQGEPPNHKMRSGGLHSPRSRGKLHPTAETIATKQLEHSQSLVPGFISRVERTKSTLLEIQEPDAPSKVHCGLQQSLDRKEIDHPPIIDLKGEKAASNSVVRKPLSYLNTFRNIYHRNGLYNNGVNNYNEDTFRNYLMNKYHRKNSTVQRPKTPFYDDFDRKGTLPSIQIGLTSIRKRPNKSRERYDPISDHANDNMMPARSVHKVGGITNSLHVLSKIGIPTKVERQLSFQLEVDLSRFRRSRDYFPFDMTPSELAKYYPPQSVNLTQGEILLRQGLESNASRRRKVVREKSHKSAPDILETRTESDTPREDGVVTVLRTESEMKHPRLIDEEEAEDAQMHINGNADEIIVPNQFNTQNKDTPKSVTHVNCAVETEETDNVESMVQYDIANATKTEKPIVTIATAKMEESSQGSVTLTGRTDSLSNVTSDIIQNVKEANVFPDTVRTNDKLLDSHEEEDDALGSTFLTSEPKAIPEVVSI